MSDLTHDLNYFGCRSFPCVVDLFSCDFIGSKVRITVFFYMSILFIFISGDASGRFNCDDAFVIVTFLMSNLRG